MPVPVGMALLSIFVELVGSTLVLLGRRVCLGAGMWAGFTAIGACTAHAFWKVSGRARVEALTIFLMHLGLIAAFVLCALVAEGAERAASPAGKRGHYGLGYSNGAAMLHDKMITSRSLRNAVLRELLKTRLRVCT